MGLRDFWERGRLPRFVERELLPEEGTLVVGAEPDEAGGVNPLVPNCDLVLLRVADLELFPESVPCRGAFVLLVDPFLEALEELESDADVVEPLRPVASALDFRRLSILARCKLSSILRFSSCQRIVQPKASV